MTAAGRRRGTRVVVGALLVLALGGCGGIGQEQVVVSAAASLTEAMEALEVAYEAGSGQDVVLNLAGSQELAAQIVAGSPAAVFAAADPVQMAVVTDAGLGLGDPARFAGNRLVIVVPEGNPEGVTDLGDLTDLVVVLGAPEVPVGAYTAEVLDAAGVVLQPASLEPSTRAVVARVVAGDADAGIAYATDAAALEGVQAVVLPAELQPDIAYEVVLLDRSGEGFLEFLASDRGTAILRRFGFTTP